MCMECNGWTRAEVLDDIAGQIDQFGWSVAGIEGDGSRPPFAYTIGLTELGHPELLLSGFPPDSAGVVLDGWSDDVAAGHRFQPGDVLNDGHGHRSAVARIPDPSRLVLAWEFYADRREEVEALQIVWSDGSGRFPGDPGYRPRNPRRQELFGRLPGSGCTARRSKPKRRRTGKRRTHH